MVSDSRQKTNSQEKLCSHDPVEAKYDFSKIVFHLRLTQMKMGVVSQDSWEEHRL